MHLARRLRSILVIGLLSVPALTVAAGKCERIIATGADDNPPFLWRDPDQPERLIGANADILKMATDAIGLQLEMLPTGDAKAALAEVSSGRVDVLADAVLVAENLDVLDYVHPPVAVLDSLVWVSPEALFPYGNRDDLRQLDGAIVKGTYLGEQFAAYAESSLHLQPLDTTEEALRQLQDGDVEYLLHEPHSLTARAKPLGLLEGLVALRPPVLSRTMHLAIAHDSACNGPWLRGELARLMTEYRAAGIPQRMIEQNIDRWAAQHATQPADTAQVSQ
ncbi:transporter substrate-binding domain-containing protein [Stutzerimonas urumqiensis]|uniref:substrate-binding periplasmic protein n=1 Tax=Stutzerimonas urumqiensis TaxID=638269 RepID=UPI003DA63447